MAQVCFEVSLPQHLSLAQWGKGPLELCWALKMLLEPGREWGEPVEELACFSLANPSLDCLPSAWLGFFLGPKCECCLPTAAVARGPRVPGLVCPAWAKPCGPCHPTPGLSHCPGWRQRSRAPQPRTELGKGHLVPSKSLGPGPALPWEEGGERSFSEGNLLFWAVSRSCGSGLGRAGFNRCKGILVSRLVGQGCRSRSLVLAKESNAAPGKQGEASAVFCLISCEDVRASGLRGRQVQAGSGHTALLPAGCPPRPWSSLCLTSL